MRYAAIFIGVKSCRYPPNFFDALRVLVDQRSTRGTFGMRDCTVERTTPSAFPGSLFVRTQRARVDPMVALRHESRLKMRADLLQGFISLVTLRKRRNRRGSY